MLCGCHYDYIDFSIIIGRETGTPASQAHIRTWMKHLSEFIHTLDLVRARPHPDLLTAQPPHTLASILAVDGEDYAIYLADTREVGDPTYGDPITGNLALDLPNRRLPHLLLLPHNRHALTRLDLPRRLPVNTPPNLPTRPAGAGHKKAIC